MASVTINGAAPKGAAPRRRSEHQAARLAHRFSNTAVGSGLYRDATSAAGIPGMAGPRVTHVDLGDRPYLMVRVLPGQKLSDFTHVADRIASGLGVDRVGITTRKPGILRIDLDPIDPLPNTVPIPDALDSGLWPISFGVLENGTELRESLLDTGHLAAQGQTRSGKTRWTYGLLGQLSGARHVEIAGIDPTGKLLGPWEGHPQGSIIDTSADYAAMEQASADLVADMRDRIRAIPRDRDVLPLGNEYPLRIIALEEWANALTIAATTKNKAKGLDTDLGKNVQMLLAEGHKVGYRVLVLSQRMDANLIGSFNRDNISHRFSFRTSSKEGMKMLHEHIDDDLAAAHAVENPGTALAQSPTVPLQRLRAADVPEYSDYLDRIDATASGAVGTAA